MRLYFEVEQQTRKTNNEIIITLELINISFIISLIFSCKICIVILNNV